MSTPGVSAEIREVSRANSNGRLEVQYHVFVTGAPKDQNYTMVSWPINARGPSALMEGLSLLKDALISCAGRTPEQCGDPNKKDDPVELTFYSATGEVFRMALISQDQVARNLRKACASDFGCFNFSRSGWESLRTFDCNSGFPLFEQHTNPKFGRPGTSCASRI